MPYKQYMQQYMELISKGVETSNTNADEQEWEERRGRGALHP